MKVLGAGSWGLGVVVVSWSGCWKGLGLGLIRGVHRNKTKLFLGGDLPSENSLLTDGGDDLNEDGSLVLLESVTDLLSDLVFWKFEVILLVARFGVHERAVSVVDGHQQVLTTLDDWNIHVVGGWADIFKLLSGENVDGDHVDLSVTVLSGLRGRHFDDLKV